MRKKEFRSRVSGLVLLTVCVAFGCLLWLGREDLFRSELMFGCIYGLMLLILIFPFTFRYTILDGFLWIKLLGIPIRKLAISDIDSVHRSYNPLSSPAGSLKRLKIVMKDSGRYFQLVSPDREKDFLLALQEVNPSLVVDVADRKTRFCMLDWDI